MTWTDLSCLSKEELIAPLQKKEEEAAVADAKLVTAEIKVGEAEAKANEAEAKANHTKEIPRKAEERFIQAEKRAQQVEEKFVYVSYSLFFRLLHRRHSPNAPVLV